MVVDILCASNILVLRARPYWRFYNVWCYVLKNLCIDFNWTLGFFLLEFAYSGFDFFICYLGYRWIFPAHSVEVYPIIFLQFFYMLVEVLFYYSYIFLVKFYVVLWLYFEYFLSILCSGIFFAFGIYSYPVVLIFDSIFTSSCSCPLNLLTCCQNRQSTLLSVSRLSTSSVHLSLLFSCVSCLSCWHNLWSSWNCLLLHPITSIC